MKIADEVFDKFEEQLRQETIGDPAHMKLFALAKELETKDPVKYKKITERCRNGHYHDFATRIAAPKTEMHVDLLEVGLKDVDERMQDGEFDS